MDVDGVISPGGLLAFDGCMIGENGRRLGIDSVKDDDSELGIGAILPERT